MIMKKIIILGIVLFALVLVSCVQSPYTSGESITKDTFISESPEETEEEPTKEAEPIEEEIVEEQPICTDECSQATCDGFYYVDCLVGDDGCKDKQSKEKIKGKCGVECLENSDCSNDEVCSSNKCKEDYELEMTSEEIFNEFGGLSEIQIGEKIKEFKGKRIKTSLYVSTVSKASFSTQYVAMEMYEYPFNLFAHVKAFFPAEEKDNLLKANVGDTLIFSGEFVTYKKSSLTSGYIEFTKSKVLDIETGSGTETIYNIPSATSKIDECTKVCAGDSYDIPVYRNEWHNICYQLYFYLGEEALDNQIAECKNE